MKKSEILHQAKHRLLANDCSFICIAINLTKYSNRKASSLKAIHNADELKQWIRHLLEGNETLEAWLKKRHRKKLNVTDPTPKSAETRMRWLDWMITYWEGEEAKSQNPGWVKAFSTTIRCAST